MFLKRFLRPIIPKPIRRLIRSIPESWKRFWFVTVFPLSQLLGFHIIPNSPGTPIPDTSTLIDDLWNKPSALIGIDMREERQIALLMEFRDLYKIEYDVFLRHVVHPHEYSVHGDSLSFAEVDAEVLYCMVRKFQPRRIYEIGSGNSTKICAKALLKNGSKNGVSPELIAIDPFPSPLLHKGFPGFTKLIQAPVQSIPLETFGDLMENDILFIDSTHCLKIGSDVQYLYLEVLPRLKKGVIIHAHDIFLPYEYPKVWIKEWHIFPNEQYLLHALLTYSIAFEVLWAGCWVHHKHPELLREAFSFYNPTISLPGSFWFRKTY